MNIVFTPFHPDDLTNLLPTLPPEWQDICAEGCGRMDAYCQEGLSWTCRVNERVVGCGGIMKRWLVWNERLRRNLGCGHLWSVSAAVPMRAWPAITGKVLSVLKTADEQGYHRLDATVLETFGHGHRWIRKFGFEVQGPLRLYDPLGQNHIGYERISL